MFVKVIRSFFREVDVEGDLIVVLNLNDFDKF